MKKSYENELTPEQLAALSDDQIDTSDIPELGEDFWKNARLVMPEETKAVSLRVEKSVLEAFKATGRAIGRA